MVITTRGIVLKFTRYRETSIITNIFTEEVGLSTFIVNNVRSAKGKFKPSYFEPLSIIELTGYHHPDREINRLNEIKVLAPMHSLRQDIYKSSIIIFLAEILNKVIIEKDKNPELFNFLYQALTSFERLEENNNFHLQFLLKMAGHLGFSVENQEDFFNESNNQQFYLDAENQDLFRRLNQSPFSKPLRVDPQKRLIILNDIIFYYQQHIGLSKLKSLEVLQTIFR